MRGIRRAPRLRSAWALAAACVLRVAGPAAGQFPAELAGRVVEAGTSLPIEAAAVEAGATRGVTDASGSFRLRATEAGATRVVVSHPGYATLDTSLVLTNGRATHVVIGLVPSPIEIDALEVVARRAAGAGFVLTRDAIEASGARTLGELLVRGVPGVVVRADAGGGARVSIRGGGADAVLVLVDGAPANDALTGEADLSTIALDDVESVRVLPGAHSARFGPRAEAGVILVRSRPAGAAGATLSARAGSFGEAEAAGTAGVRLAGGGSLGAGVRLTEQDDAFEYARPDALGGGSATRTNAARRALVAYGSAALRLAGGPLRVRIDALDAARGLPGPMHALTPEARQDVTRATAAASWRSGGAGTSLRLDGSASWQRVRFEDPAPAIGAAYSDTARVREAGLRVEAMRVTDARLARTLAAGAELRAMWLESSTLDPRELERRDVGVFTRASVELADAALAPSLSLALRADRWRGEWIASHDVTARVQLGVAAVHASHRSGFSPPTPADQFFRGGISIAPNAALEPERVPHELELGVSASLRAGAVPLELGASAFRADVDGMIVWAPDFRFVWSPRNRDVRRSGGEAWLRATPARSLELCGWASVARVTYDWPGEADTVQVVYRPRYSGGASLDWHPGAWRVGIAARYTGVRYATPGHANPLSAYWDVDAALAREWRIAPVLLTTSLSVERLLDNRDAFIHGYPEPGRRLRLELRAQPMSTRTPNEQ